jgi:RIO-like serine/threonine protein kinase
MSTAPPTCDAFVELVRKSRLIEPKRLHTYLRQLRALAVIPCEPKELATVLIQNGFLTYFQAMQLLKGRYKGFYLNKYKVLERLGSGSNSSVFLCQHLSMRRKVALKILPIGKAEDPSSLARFYREARAAAALDHPNIVRTYDNGQDGDLHFLVMEYVDGSSMQEIIKKQGPMEIARAAAYIRQAAMGLHHIHQAGLIHRDIKPGNILLERRGIVKLLDLGLARFYQDHWDMLTQQNNQMTILGTADYLSPEQTLNSHDVDIRTDIYGLGATFYYLLAGRPPFDVKAVSQKLLAHLLKEPTPLRELRAEVPEALAAVIEKMMAKDRAQRYPSAAAVVAALSAWTQTPVAPPPAQEMPQLCSAAQHAGSGEEASLEPAAASLSDSVSRTRREAAAYTPHAAFERQDVRAGPSAAMVGASQTVSREASRRGDASPYEPPGGAPEVPRITATEPPGSATSPKLPPGEKQRAPGQKPSADTVSSLSGFDTDPNLAKPIRRSTPRKQSTSPRRWSMTRRKKVEMLCLAAAVLTGILLHALLSRSPARTHAHEPLPEAGQPAEPDPQKHSPTPVRPEGLKSQTRTETQANDRPSGSPFAVYTKSTATPKPTAVATPQTVAGSH